MDELQENHAASQKAGALIITEYYVLDAPTNPDYEYDMLMRRLEELEQAHP